MGRSKVSPIQQPDNTTCGPSSIKTALAILGIRKSLDSIMSLCKTTKSGTTTKNLITAINSLGLPVMAIEYATLTHLRSALKNTPKRIRAVLVSYLYDDDENDQPHPDSGHWAAVAGFRSDRSRIILLDSNCAKRKSYDWQEFRKRWNDYDLKKRRISKATNKFRFIKKWQPQLMLVIARDPGDLPKFSIATSKIFLPATEE